MWGRRGDSFDRSIYISELKEMGRYGGQVTGEMLDYVEKLDYGK